MQLFNEPIGTQSGQNRPDYFVDIFLTKAFLSKIFEGEMFIRIFPTTLLQIFCENLLYFQVIFKSMKIAYDTFLGNSECEWVNTSSLLFRKQNDMFTMIILFLSKKTCFHFLIKNLKILDMLKQFIIFSKSNEEIK